jgi:hypothetical protein
MKHFAVEAWFDFVREVAPPELGTLMQRHLSDGCKRCAKLCEMWQQVADITRREAAFEPPDRTVRSVKEIRFQRPLITKEVGEMKPYRITLVVTTASKKIEVFIEGPGIAAGELHQKFSSRREAQDFVDAMNLSFAEGLKEGAKAPKMASAGSSPF